MRYAIHTLLSRTAHLMRNDLRPHLSAIGLSPGQPKVLRSLMTREPLIWVRAVGQTRILSTWIRTIFSPVIINNPLHQVVCISSERMDTL